MWSNSNLIIIFVNPFRFSFKVITLMSKIIMNITRYFLFLNLNLLIIMHQVFTWKFRQYCMILYLLRFFQLFFILNFRNYIYLINYLLYLKLVHFIFYLCTMIEKFRLLFKPIINLNYNPNIFNSKVIIEYTQGYIYTYS